MKACSAQEPYAAKLRLFDNGITYSKLAGYAARGASIKTTRLSEEFTLDEYHQQYKDVPLHYVPLNLMKR